jgi:catechol 2,3-dioxygenase-like lactoylglutathione lyase family enzyme
MIKSGNVTVMVSDLNRAIQFYTETLGLQLKYRVENEWAEIETPGLSIGLHPAGDKGSQPGQAGGLSIGLSVESLDAAMAALAAKGVTFAPNITSDGPVRIAFFTDPDNNPLYLCEVRGSWS